MISKTYRAGSLSAAVAQIRSEMGAGAAIVSARTITAKRTLFQTIPAQIELEARVEEHDLTHEQLSKLGLIPKTDEEAAIEKSAQQKLEEKIEQLEKENAELRAELEQMSGTIDEVKLVQMATKNLRSLQPEVQQSSPQSEMTQRLLENGFDDSVLASWRQHLNKNGFPADEQNLTEQTIEFLSEVIEFGDIDHLHSRFVAFVGPQGSGKTTSLLKIAKYWQDQGESVTILALPGCDPRGIDFLSDSAASLNIPLKVAVHAREVVGLAEACATADRILIDTPSLEAGDAIAVKRLAKWLDPWLASTIAVFDARDGLAIPHLETLRDLRVAGTIFTGIDRSFPIGVPYNIGFASKRPCFAFGTGQDLKSDFEPATPDRLISILLNIEPESTDDQAIEFSLETEQKGVSL